MSKNIRLSSKTIVIKIMHMIRIIYASNLLFHIAAVPFSMCNFQISTFLCALFVFTRCVYVCERSALLILLNFENKCIRKLIAIPFAVRLSSASAIFSLAQTLAICTQMKRSAKETIAQRMEI